jgi:hypothetical protein
MVDTLTEIAVHRLGSGKVHRANVFSGDLLPATHWGAPCTSIALDSVATLCGVVLRGRDIIQIPEGDALDSWRRNRGVCKPCERISEVRSV